MPELPYRLTRAEFRAAILERAGEAATDEQLDGPWSGAPDGLKAVAWRCPACGATCTMQQAREIKASAQLATQQCIHRMLADGKCDWCAGGLFRTLNEGHLVICEDGSEISVFSFADEPKAVASHA